jgi:hypothetical protein
MLFPFIILWEIIAILFLSNVKRGESKKFTAKQLVKLRREYEN